MNQRNYDKEMERMITELKGEEKPSLLLHACCAPCSSGCVERVVPFFDTTVYFYNPNLTEETEYRKRVREENRFLSEFPLTSELNVKMIEGPYDPEHFMEAVRGLEDEPERGKRCLVCFALRLKQSASYARENGYDFLTTTLTLSPLKSAETLNRIGESVCKDTGVRWLPTDFKKKNGYQRSLQLSKEYELYRQNYCGCVFSKHQREAENGKS